jgi:photosystem II stability/assembly factor-like uncharacterized protein
MRKTFLCVVSVGAAYLGSLATALPALAGVNRWTAIGPDGTNVVALAIDPRTPSTAFAGTLGSGVLKTVDGGASWTTANGALPATNVLALAIDPSTPSTLFAGTDAGVFKSTNSGKSWSAANGGQASMPQSTVNALAIGSDSPVTLYAATSRGVFKSIDGAANWISINVGLSGLTPRVIALDPTSPTTLYVGVDDYEQDVRYGVFKSTDAGTSWSRIYTTTPYGDGGAPAVVAIGVDPRAPSRLYLALSFGDLLISQDGGANWSRVKVPPPELWSLAIDPAAPATLYAGTYSGGVSRSTDAGDHWTSVTDGPLAAASINVFALSAWASATVYAGGGTGIFRSADSGATWTRLTLGVRNVGASELVVDPAAPSTIYTAAGSVVAKTTDGGIGWVDSTVATADQWINSLVIDPASPSTLYASAGFAPPVYKSTDAGAHWVAASRGLPDFGDVQAIAIAPSAPSTLYVGVAFAGVSKSTDGGLSWSRVNNGLTAVGLYTSALAVDPTSADIVYVATPPTGRPDSDAKIFKSTDGAAQWRQTPIALPPGALITSLAIDPAAPSTIYAAYVDYATGLGGVFRSNDGGETWTAPPKPLPTGCCVMLAIDPGSSSRIYAATQGGVFRSTDRATSWTSFNTGLPTLDVRKMAIDRTGSLLRAATAAGLYEYEVSGAPFPETVSLIEYVHAAFGHYFITSIPDEISELDNGVFAGWVRTGFKFNVYAVPNENSAPVCRFFSTAFGPKSSHFYTPFAAECATRQTDANWLLESAAAFDIAIPASDGSCAAGFAPVYRLYNNGQGGAPNHRYTTDPTVRAQTIAQGWVPEGPGPNAVGMCSPP